MIYYTIINIQIIIIISFLNFLFIEFIISILDFFVDNFRVIFLHMIINQLIMHVLAHKIKYLY